VRLKNVSHLDPTKILIDLDFYSTDTFDSCELPVQRDIVKEITGFHRIEIRRFRKRGKAILIPAADSCPALAWAARSVAERITSGVSICGLGIIGKSGPVIQHFLPIAASSASISGFDLPCH
jgi:hypothetical protein